MNEDISNNDNQAAIREFQRDYLDFLDDEVSPSSLKHLLLCAQN